MDFILFPEMYLTGYNNEFDSSKVEKALAQIAQAAKRHKINILMGTGSRHLGVAVNQVRIFSKKGNLAGIYKKILLTPVDLAEGFEPGHLKVFKLDGLCFAALICNDLWATPASSHGTVPLLVQQAQDMGASIIFHSIACSGETNPDKGRILKDWAVANHQTWAMRIGITIVAADQPGELGSLVNSGIIGPEGEYITQVPNKGEHLFVAEIPAPR